MRKHKDSTNKKRTRRKVAEPENAQPEDDEQDDGEREEPKLKYVRWQIRNRGKLKMLLRQTNKEK